MKTQGFITLIILLISVSSIQGQNKHYDYLNRVPGNKPHILYISGDDTHGSLEVAAVLRKFLEVRHNYFMTYTEDYSILTRSLDKYDVILMNNIPPKMTPEEIQGLSKAISNGKPFLGMHAISASYKMPEKQKAIILDIIGAQFNSHPAIYEFEVNVKELNTPITNNLSDFTIYDEMYFFTKINSDVNVLISADYKKNDISTEDWEKTFGKSKSTPIAWTRNYGKAKVFYTSLGHSLGAVTNRHFQQLILNALTWLLEE